MARKSKQERKLERLLSTYDDVTCCLDQEVDGFGPVKRVRGYIVGNKEIVVQYYEDGDIQVFGDLGCTAYDDDLLTPQGKLDSYLFNS